mmetsp:Transcript_46707/g.134529  ORF Transcript_46707/g.134529 Transcript_46707/m.134529 type:complete len:487 (-) Transcript_46707:194-1654(-)
MRGFSQLLRDRGFSAAGGVSAEKPQALEAVSSRDLVSSACVGAPATYVVDNSQLRSLDNGISFRTRPDFNDDCIADDARLAKFGTIVLGVPHSAGWIRVGAYFLPIEVGGKPVLQRADWLDSDASEDEDQHLSSGERSSRASERRRPLRRIGRLRVPEVLRPPSAEPGPEEGALHEVIAERVVIREGPSQGASAQGFAKKGSVVKLFEWDESCAWRRSWADRTGWGWMMLDHPDYGPLLRPVGAKLCAQPLEPMCVAATEGFVAELRRFIDRGMDPNVRDMEGRRPLQLAVAFGHIECCMELLLAGAEVPCLEELRHPGQGRRSRQAAALAASFTGVVQSPEDYEDALSALPAALRKQAHAVLRPAAVHSCAASSITDKRSAQEELRTVSRNPNLSEAPPSDCTQGMLYEVAYSAVWIRRGPSTTAETVSKRMRGEVVRILSVDDATGCWGRVHIATAEGSIDGWMLLRHPGLGDLLRPLHSEVMG